MFGKKEEKNIHFDEKKLKESLSSLQKQIESLNAELNQVKEQLQKAVQFVGIVRYNPFAETGGDQSFSIALLDEERNGVVVTSHYGREANRVYAKPIKALESKYPLTEEELQAIDLAVSGKQSKKKK